MWSCVSAFAFACHVFPSFCRHGRSCGGHEERTLCWSSLSVILCFDTVRHASDLLGCRMRLWTRTRAVPRECSERNAINMLTLFVNGCFMQSSEPLSLLLVCPFVHLADQNKRNKSIRCSRIVPVFTLHVPPEHARTSKDDGSAEFWQCDDGQRHVERNVLYHLTVTGACS